MVKMMMMWLADILLILTTWLANTIRNRIEKSELFKFYLAIVLIVAELAVDAAVAAQRYVDANGILAVKFIFDAFWRRWIGETLSFLINNWLDVGITFRFPIGRDGGENGVECGPEGSVVGVEPQMKNVRLWENNVDLGAAKMAQSVT